MQVRGLGQRPSNVVPHRQKRRRQRRNVQILLDQRGRSSLQRLSSHQRLCERLRGRYKATRVRSLGKRLAAANDAHSAGQDHRVSLAQVSRLGQQLQEANSSRHRTPIGRFSPRQSALFCVSWGSRTLLRENHKRQRSRLQVPNEAEIQRTHEQGVPKRVDTSPKDNRRRLQGRQESNSGMSQRHNQ